MTIGNATLAVLTVHGQVVTMAALDSGEIFIPALAACDVCTDLEWPPPQEIVPAASAAGLVSLEQLRQWGNASGARAAVQAHELAEIVEHHANTKNPTRKKPENV